MLLPLAFGAEFGVLDRSTVCLFGSSIGSGILIWPFCPPVWIDIAYFGSCCSSAHLCSPWNTCICSGQGIGSRA